MRVAVVAGLTFLAACSGTGPRPIPPAAGDTCRNEGLDAYVGRKADTVLGAEMLRRSGARSLRWAPPRSAITMDFRGDRLTVTYDDAMLVTSARCG